MDYLYLYNLVERKRYEDENFSFPFLVKLENGSIYYSWFAFELVGSRQTGVFVHISRVLVLKKDEQIISYPTSFDVPCIVDTESKENLMAYLQSLTNLEGDFDEEKMNHMLQDYGMKPFFHAFQCVRNYVKTHYKEV